jgi:hypothetical protein
MFVTPYPPGFPILVPGQVVTSDILDFMSVLDTREIHGYLREFGYRVFTEEVLQDSGHDKPTPHCGLAHYPSMTSVMTSGRWRSSSTEPTSVMGPGKPHTEPQPTATDRTPTPTHDGLTRPRRCGADHRGEALKVVLDSRPGVVAGSILGQVPAPVGPASHSIA